MKNCISLPARLDWVDGLKGVCAIIVVLQHTLVTILGMSAFATCRIPVVHNFWNGNFAVSVFIILSTILTCHGIERSREQLLQRYQYIVLKRYFRLVVPVGVIIVGMYLFNLVGLFHAEEYGAKTNNEWLMHTTESLVHLPGNILCAPLGGCYTILRVGWMLKYVFLGTMYVIILDLLLAQRRDSSKLFLLAICTYIAYKCDFYYVNVVAGYFLYSFRNKLNFRGAKKIVLVVFVVGIFCASDFYYTSDEWNMQRAVCWVSLFYLLPSAQTLFAQKKLVWMGKISMNIYLLHMTVLYMITCRMADAMSLSLVNMSIMFAVTLSATVALAYGYTRYVERMLNVMVDKMLEKLK